ncbi:MAG: nucleotidyltransferase domain-containing protein [Gemmatimonadota bacterium]
MCLHGEPLTPPELAWRAGISRAGAWNALEALEEIGIVGPVGTGGSVPYQLNEAHPLADTIRTLYAEEANRADGVFSEVRTAAATLDPPPLAVWLYGSVARAEDRADSDLDIAVVGRDREDARSGARQLREALEGFAARWAIHPSVISLSGEEIEALRRDNNEFWQRIIEDGIPLLGTAPEALEIVG